MQACHAPTTRLIIFICGIVYAGMPRANYAPSTEKPNGSITEANPAPKLTVMQQHILFW
jgi:hypothetical protein